MRNEKPKELSNVHSKNLKMKNEKEENMNITK